MAKDISAVAAGTVGAGVLLLWSALTGASVLSSLQDLVTGKKPAGTKAHPIQQPSAPPASSSSSGGGGGGPTPPGGKAPGDLGANPSGGGGTPSPSPPIQLPQLAPPPPAYTPPTHVQAPPKPSRPWWDPRGWF
jgi:hypothetical protein